MNVATIERIRQLTGARKKRRVVGYVPRLPVGAETAYVSALRKHVKALHERTMRSLEAPMRALAALDTGQRMDGPIEDMISAIIAGQAAAASDVVTSAVFATIVRIWSRVNDHNRGEMERVLGITGPLLDPDLSVELDVWRDANVRLIQSVGSEYLDDVLELVAEAQRTGMRVETLRERIVERFGVSQSRADLIARDQVLKANADLTRIRQRRVGVTSYRWSTSKDSRVRSGHAALEGQVFRWDAPPVVDASGRRAHPGTDFQCRCVAIAVFDSDGTG